MILDLAEMDDYSLEELRNKYYSRIWEWGTRHVGEDVLETYRAVCLELEYRDQQRPKAPVVSID